MSHETPQIPTASGARLAGDDFQHLYTWFHALHLLRDAECVTRVEFELREAGNVDDLVVHRRGRPALYHQIKFVLDQREPLAAAWFTIIPSNAKSSPLQRFHESFKLLTGKNGPPELALYTNRQLVAKDPILQHIDSRTDKLGPRLLDSTPGSEAGKARLSWAQHLGVSDEELREMLRHLEILPGRGSLNDLQHRCAVFMEAVGLRADFTAVSLGRNEIRQLIINGCSALEAEQMRELVTKLGLKRITPRGTLLIQAIDRDKWPQTATVSLDWVDEFIGDEPLSRRQLRDPRLWNTKLKAELTQAAAEIRCQGFNQVRIDGAFRLATGFLVGTLFPRVAGVEVTWRDWQSDIPAAMFPLAIREQEIGQGDEIAIALSVTWDITEDVFDYIRRERLPVSRFINLSPTEGPGQQAIPNSAAALGCAHAALAEIHTAARGREKLHFFQAGPNGIGILLGHLWNRVPKTQLYEDANSPEGYFPTFTLKA